MLIKLSHNHFYDVNLERERKKRAQSKRHVMVNGGVGIQQKLIFSGVLLKALVLLDTVWRRESFCFVHQRYTRISWMKSNCYPRHRTRLWSSVVNENPPVARRWMEKCKSQSPNKSRDFIKMEILSAFAFFGQSIMRPSIVRVWRQWTVFRIIRCDADLCKVNARCFGS